MRSKGIMLTAAEWRAMPLARFVEPRVGLQFHGGVDDEGGRYEVLDVLEDGGVALKRVDGPAPALRLAERELRALGRNPVIAQRPHQSVPDAVLLLLSDDEVVALERMPRRLPN